MIWVLKFMLAACLQARWVLVGLSEDSCKEEKGNGAK